MEEKIKIKSTEELWKEGNMFESYCPELDITSCGDSIEQAKKNLMEVILINFEEAQKMGHRQRLVPGPMTFSVAMGLVEETGWFDHVLAALEFDELRFKKALHPEHSVKVEITVKDNKLTRNPKRGLVDLSFRVFNQDNEIVLSTEAKYLIKTRH